MSEKKRIKIVAKPKEEFTVELVGKEYLAKAPKSTLGIMLSQDMQNAGEDADKAFESLLEFLEQIFSKKQASSILNRLKDKSDDLDIPHIMELLEAMTEDATEDPTT